MAIVVSLIDVATASIVEKAIGPLSKGFLGGRLSRRRGRRSGCCLRAGDARDMHIFKFIFFLILL